MKMNTKNDAPAPGPEIMALLSDVREEQRRAILSDAPLVVVGAGAGTGKTHTLARRFAWLLASDPACRVDQILTLTFTQKAASEMRERIGSTLCEWRGAAGHGLPHLDDACRRIDEAYISTIHAFALRVVRESGLSLDVDPGASLVGEPVENEFWADFAWNLETLNTGRLCRMLDEKWRARAVSLLGEESFGRFLSYFGAARLAALAKAAGELHGSMNRRPDELWDFDPERERALRELVAAELDPEWRAAWNLWRGEVIPGVDLSPADTTILGGGMRDLRERWSEAGEYTPELGRRFYADLIGGMLNKLPGAGKLKTRIEEVLGCKLVDWRNEERKRMCRISGSLAGEPGYSPAEAQARTLLLRTAALGAACWEQQRSRLGALSFADLIRHAASALRLDPRYARRFRHIMIDEFQDTDGLQEDLAASMARSWPAGERRSLFVVGDIKQSIYRFRHADPRLFAAYIRKCGGGDGEHISLACSYRGSGPLLRDINAVFGHIWQKGVIAGEGGAARYEPLAPPVDAPWWPEREAGAAEQPLELLLAAAPSQEEGAPAIPVAGRRSALARALAARLLQVKDETGVWSGGAYRPAEWRDIAVLVPTRTQYPALEEAFEDAGIPAAFGGGREYFNRGEVRDLVNLLRLLDAPGDDYALAGWLESPFSGLPPGEGIRLLGAARSSETGLREALLAEYPDAAARLASLRRRARAVAPSAALLTLLEDSGWIAAYRPETRPRVIAGVRRGIDIAREYEASFGSNLGACADYLGRAMKAGVHVDEMPFEEADAVAVMTIHASKGLEFPIVALLGLEAPVKADVSRARGIVSKTLGLTSKSWPSPAGEEFPEQEEIPGITALWHSFAESRELAEEHERLFYVAMTRAKERLICCALLSGAQSPEPGADFYPRPAEGSENRRAGKTAATWLDLLLAAERERGRPFPATIVETGGVAGGRAPGLSAPKPPIVASRPEAPVPRLERLSASAYSLFDWCPHAYRMRYRQGRELVWEMPDGDGQGGADVGTLAHWLLSRWSFEPGELDLLLKPEAGRDEIETELRALPAFIRPAYSSRNVRNTLHSWLALFAASPASGEFREAKSRGILSCELAFRIPFGGIRLVGSIDAYWEDEKGRHVRDWKITPESGAPERMYMSQVEFYALACRAVKAAPPVDVKLVYLRPGAVARESLRVDDWDALEEKVRAAAQAAASGPFPRFEERCGECPFSGPCRPRQAGRSQGPDGRR